MVFWINYWKVLNEMKRSKEVPEEWNMVYITTIFKNKGSKKELVNYRGIFLTVIVKKILENMIKKRMEKPLEKVNKHQGGSRSNRSPSDNLFLLYACIDHQKYKNKPLFVTAYDFEQAFDALWLQDCILSLEKIGVPTDLLHLIYNLNKKAKITVKTPYGRTNPSVLYDIVEQGTVLGSTLCSTATAEYCETNVGIAVNNTVVSSLVWVDDILDLSVSSKNAEKSHEGAMLFGRRKKLAYSKTKCKTMVINGKKRDEPPQLCIGDIKVGIVQQIEYLGDVINSKGDFSDLIKDREKRGITAMVQIEAILREADLGIHTVSVHLLLYQTLFLSCTLFNSQAWSSIKEADIMKLEKIQLKCLKKILHMATSITNSLIFLELGELPLGYIVDRNQLNFLHHIYHLENNDPVRVMWEAMNNLTGEKNWWSRVKGLMTKYKVSIENVKIMTSQSFKCMVKKKNKRGCSSGTYRAVQSKTKNKFVKVQLSTTTKISRGDVSKSGKNNTPMSIQDPRYQGFPPVCIQGYGMSNVFEGRRDPVPHR